MRNFGSQSYLFSPDPEIKQVRAEELDPDTDIYGHLVTAALGKLQPKTWQQALLNGLAKLGKFLSRA